MRLEQVEAPWELHEKAIEAVALQKLQKLVVGSGWLSFRFRRAAQPVLEADSFGQEVKAVATRLVG